MAEAMREDMLALPCPFCGAIPYVAVKDRAVISCRDDECFRPRTAADYLVDAIKQWNRRAAAPPEGVREQTIELWQIDETKSENQPYNAQYEREYLVKRIRDGGPKAVAGMLFTYAISQPREGSFAGSLWALAEWITTHAAALSPAAAGGETTQAYIQRLENALKEKVCNADDLPDQLTPPAINELFARGDLYTARAVFARLRNFGYDLVRKSSLSAQSARVKSLEEKIRPILDIIDDEWNFRGAHPYRVALIAGLKAALLSSSDQTK